MKPGSPEWHKRLDALLADEDLHPLTWWYLSFATDSGFLGACIVKARGVASAIGRAHSLGINPGGDVMGFDCGDDPGPLPVDRLLRRGDLGPGNTVGELEAQGIMPGANVRFVD